MEINFNYETEFQLDDEIKYADWINRIIISEGYSCSELSYIFCDDEYLLRLNNEYLSHNTFTDIITFDYTKNKEVSGDVFISHERVQENAENFKVDYDNELKRVMAHGVLHLMGYRDKSSSEQELMRRKEEEKIQMFHVEQ